LAVVGKRVVLVTGAHRSGTSILGEFLNVAGGVEVWEPFNPDWGLRAIGGPYPYLTPDGPAGAEISALVRYLSTGRATWRKKGNPRIPASVWAAQNTTKQALVWARSVRTAKTVVVKDPFLLLGLESFAKYVSPGPAVISIKHPCAWALSLARVGWPAGRQATALLAQPGVRAVVADRLPEKYLDVKDWSAVGPLESAAVTWTCLYAMVEHQRDHGAKTHVVRVERLASLPEEVLGDLYEVTGLTPKTDIATIAAQYTSADTVQPDGSVIHQLRRDSKSLALSWREQMSPADQARVLAIVEPTYKAFYADWDDPRTD
jgi:hypothetical protein